MLMSHGAENPGLVEMSAPCRLKCDSLALEMREGLGDLFDFAS